MSAHDDIRYLVARYSSLWDDRRFDEWIQLFTPAAVFDWRGHLAHGPVAIQRMIGEGNTDRPTEPDSHIMANPIIDLGEHTARVVSDFLYVVARQGRYNIVHAGRAYDQLVVTPQGWRFAARAVRFLGDDAPEGWN
jgi:3-phenylpropionate/cinnamic acid dioxygenase small subunit